jgi:hypothetical protein
MGSEIRTVPRCRVGTDIAGCRAAQQRDVSLAHAQELVASLESESSEIPLRRTDLHARFMVSRVRERVTQWTAQGPSAAGDTADPGPLEKIDVIPGILAVPAHREDGDKIAGTATSLLILRSVVIVPERRCCAPQDG